MTTDTHLRARLVLHGALVVLLGLLAGLPTTVESLQSDASRAWHTAHEALIMMGVWMLAESSVLPVLVLGTREARALHHSMLAMGYGFAVSLWIGGFAGISPFEPGQGMVAHVAFGAAVLGILGAVLGTSLTIMGAVGALRGGRGE